MKLYITILIAVLFASCFGLSCFAACPSADLTGDCYVDFEDFAIMAGQWLGNDFMSVAVFAEQWLTTDPCIPQDMAYAFSRSSIAFLNGTQYGDNEKRTQNVLLVSTSDGAIRVAEGKGGEHVVPQCIVGSTMYGKGGTTFKIYKTNDGVSWSRTGLWNTAVNGNMYATSAGTLLWVDSDTRKMYRSTDSGANFTEVASPDWVAGASSTWNTPWVFAEHAGTILMVEYGAASALGGRYIHRSVDDGATWTRVLDTDTFFTAKPFHFHTVAYHSGIGKWVAMLGDGRPRRAQITSSDDGLTWVKSYAEGTGSDQPISLYDDGDAKTFLTGTDGAATIGTVDANTGYLESLFTNTDLRQNRMYCWSITKVNGIYYAGSMDTSISGKERAVLWVSPDKINWSVYHRFTTGEAKGFYRYVGFFGGKLHYDIYGDIARRHFSISPAKVQLITGTLIEPTASNLIASIDQSSSETLAQWFSVVGQNWTLSKTTATHLHGSACAKGLGMDASVGTKNTISSAITLGNVGVNKTYIFSFYAKTVSGKNEPVDADLRLTDGTPLNPDISVYTNLDKNWKRVISSPITIPAGTPVAYRVYTTITQGVPAATIFIDCFQIQELPLTSWQIGGTDKTADVSTAAVTTPAAWTDLFTVQTIGLSSQYAASANLYIKTWKLAANANNFVSLYYNPTDSKFYIQRTIDGTPSDAVATTEQYWNSNAILKFAFQSNADGISLSIQNGKEIETITDDAITLINSRRITMLHSSIEENDQFPGIYVDEETTNGKYSLTGFAPSWLTSADIIKLFNLKSSDIANLEKFCEHWLETGCVPPYGCEGTDLDNDTKVNFKDFAIFAQHWLEGI